MLALARMPPLVAKVLAGERRDRVEDAGATAEGRCEPELLRAAGRAHVEQVGFISRESREWRSERRLPLARFTKIRELACAVA
jgi:hypothetical protein